MLEDEEEHKRDLRGFHVSNRSGFQRMEGVAGRPCLVCCRSIATHVSDPDRVHGPIPFDDELKITTWTSDS